MTFEHRAGRTGTGVQRESRSAGAPGKRTLTEGLAAATTPPAVHAAAEAGTRGAGGPLPHLDLIQKSFGRHDVGHVRAHDDAAARGSAEAMGAAAYATGDHVAFAGAPSLHTAAHEAAHVIQQRGGVQLAGGVGAAGDRHEQRADAVADRVVQGRSAESLLDEDAGPGTAQAGASHAVQRLYQPIVTSAPSTAIHIRDFITLVEGEEARWPGEQDQTALMITRLRKIFYGTPGWDQYLIPGAASVSSGYVIGVQEDRRETLNVGMVIDPGDPEIVRSHQTVTDPWTGETPEIASQQEVMLEDGSFCDVGHVFAGLDAANHPTSISAPLGVATVNDNIGAVTWTGDLGSVMAEIAFAALNDGQPSTLADAQPIIDEYAPAQDMLGNIDAYAMASVFDITTSGRRTVSSLLREYYLGETSTAGGDARVHRFSRFCASTGLTGWSGGSFSNEAAWLDRWTPEVVGAAALYVGATTDGLLTAPSRLTLLRSIQGSAGTSLARILVQGFLDALRPRVTAEPP